MLVMAKSPVASVSHKAIRKHEFNVFFIVLVQLIGIYLFGSGFLLTRNALPNITPKDEAAEPVFQKAVILIIDALRYDFAQWDNEFTLQNQDECYFKNQLPVLQRVLNDSPNHTLFYKFIADPPTTSLQRLQGLMTGSLPAFVEMGSNFGADRIGEDNVIDQLRTSGKCVRFAGDDTWIGVFGKGAFSCGAWDYPSFDVWDLDTVDNGVQEHVRRSIHASRKVFEGSASAEELHDGSWDVLIGHGLGVDHAGHRYGPNHPEMARKLTEMNDLVEEIIRVLEGQDVLLVVMGDHGMDVKGDHGGESKLELEAALWVHSLSRPWWQQMEYADKVISQHKSQPFHPEGIHIPHQPTGQEDVRTIYQTSLVPSLSLLLGVPIPFSSLGTIIPEMFVRTDCQGPKGACLYENGLRNFQNAVLANAKQIKTYFTAYTGVAPTEGRLNMEGAETGRLLQDMHSIAEEFRRTWARFDNLRMTIGISIFALAVMGILWMAVDNVRELSLTGFMSLVFAILHASSLLSNSFIIHEDRISHFFTTTLLLSASARVRQPFGYAFVAAIISRVLTEIVQCREEQAPGCISTFFATQDSSEAPLWVFWTFLAVPGILHTMCREPSLRKAVWCMSASSTLMGLHWMLEEGWWPLLGLLNIVIGGVRHEEKRIYSIYLARTAVGVAGLAVLILLRSSKSTSVKQRSEFRILVTITGLLITQLPTGILTLIASGILMINVIRSDVSPEVRGCMMVLVGLRAFFATGHQMTVSAIQWSVGLVGLNEMVKLISGPVVVLNAVAGIIMPLSGLDSPTNSIRTIWWLLLYSSVIALGGHLAALVHQRHLMLWKIFAPRYMFGVVTMLAVYIFIVIRWVFGKY